MAGGFVLAVAATGSLAQEGSCISALQSRIRAGEAVVEATRALDAHCSELKARIDAFVAAEAALRKSHRAVRRACPAGEFVRADADASARSRFVLEAARKRLANCPQPARK
jgi:predicted metal-dependent hydrolase